MSNSLADLLKNRQFNEPPEAAAIKKFIEDKYHKPAAVMVRDRDIVITVPSAAMASALRMHIPTMQQLAQTEKKLVLRIG